MGDRERASDTRAIVTLTTSANLLLIDTVARLFEVYWNTITAAVRAVVKDRLPRCDLGTIVQIGNGEIYRKKGTRNKTQVYDLEQNAYCGAARDERKNRWDALSGLFINCGRRYCCLQ